jgi:uncharacterized protein
LRGAATPRGGVGTALNEGAVVNATASRLVRALGLRPHPEGGYFTETYRSGVQIAAGTGPRAALTSIYYLLGGDTFSAFHRLASDEIWHHYRGGRVAIDTIGADRRHRRYVLGDRKHFQAAIPAGIWFAAHVVERRSYALLGCDVAPGFDYADFEIGTRATLLNEFPEHARLIERFTHLSS